MNYMKNNLTLILGLGLLFSACSDREKGKSVGSNLLENLAVTVDTVRVDVGGELINVGNYEKFALSADATRIFFHYRGGSEIHEIDLDQMRLVDRHVLADDGPNRAPQYVQGFQGVPEDQFFMFSPGLAGIYGLDGEKSETISTQLAELPGLEELEGVTFFPHVWISPDRSKLMAIPYKHDGWFLKLAVVDLATQTGKVYPLPALDVTQDYQVNWEEEGMLYRAGDFVGGFWLKDRLVIGSATTADLYFYDWQGDSLRLIENEPRLLPKMKTGTIPKTVASQAAWTEISRQLGKMVSYKQLFYDPSRRLYFRLATQNAKYGADNKRLGNELWLLAYDLELRLIGEQLIKELATFPMNPFFGDGKLYDYTVLDEDPGFTVWGFEF